MVKSSLKRENISRYHHYDKGVTWGDLAIYEFPNILGDNPGVTTGGTPLTIDWTPYKEITLDITVYEFLRQGDRRRHRKDLILKGGDRDAYLLSLGYTLDAIMDAAEEVRKIRESRRSSLKGGPWNRFVDLIEGATKGTSKGFRRLKISAEVASKPEEVVNRTTSNSKQLPKIRIAKSA